MFLRILESICGVMQRKEEMAWSGKCCTMPGQRCSNSQFALSHLCLFASILKNLTRIERIGCLFGSCAFGSTFLAELGIKNGIVVNDFVSACQCQHPTNLQKTGNGHKMNFLSHFACWYEYFLYLCKSNDGYGNNEYYFKI